ncbi:hypothetical protein RvY_00853-2 [Ramazzottius varieornatus]|uniref:Uncharacterized protein n=1 Tax=Ramazzottius varieornatus TaxID=947166 RepID=A0A1D1UEN3_RAMVA|nr:hypothetical protein RvY_00853-2 [Ramazzottius varieornatus]
MLSSFFYNSPTSKSREFRDLKRWVRQTLWRLLPDRDIPASKRHCGEYSLEIHNLPVPNSALRQPSQIPSFFEPLALRSFACVFLEHGNSLWKVEFYSEKDMEMALENKQWEVGRRPD